MKNLRRVIRQLIIESQSDNYSVENPLGKLFLRGPLSGRPETPEEESLKNEGEPMTPEEKEFLAKAISHIKNNDSGDWDHELIDKMKSYLNHPIYSKDLKFNPRNTDYLYRGMTVNKRFCEEVLDEEYTLRGWQYEQIWTFEDYNREAFGEFELKGFPCNFMFDADAQQDIYGSRKIVSAWTQRFDKAKWFADKTFDETRRFERGDIEKQSIVLVASIDGPNSEIFMNMAEFSEFEDVAGSYKAEEEWLALGGVQCVGWIPINNGWNEQ